MMISDAMNAKLNEQIASEFAAAHSYLAMACSFDGLGYKILAKRFFAQHEEERDHALKILRFVQEVGGSVALEVIPKPQTQYASAADIVNAALESEKKITEQVNAIAALAESEKDYATRSFINWFVDEQVEEVASMAELANLIELAQGNILQVETRVRHDMMAKP